MKFKPVHILVFLLAVCITAISVNFFVLKKNFDPKDLILDAFSFCSSNSSNRTESILCVRKFLEKDMAKNDIGPFIVSVDDMISSGELSPTSAECHNIVHAIGQVGGMYSQNINETILQCSSLCTYGCFHGVVEGFVMGGGDLFKEISSLCRIENNRLFESACYHGLGHGFASIADYDIKKAFSFCDLLSAEGQRINCGFGVFMELYGMGSFAHAPLEWPENIPEFCQTLTDPYSFICHISAGSQEYSRSQDTAKAFGTCQSVPQETFSRCNIGIGRIVYHLFKDSELKIIEACQNNRNNSEDVFLDCIRGAVDASYDFNSEKGLEICRSINGELGLKCLEALERGQVP